MFILGEYQSIYYLIILRDYFQLISVSEGQLVNNSVILNNANVNMLQNLVNGKASLTTINGQQVIIRPAAGTGTHNYARILFEIIFNLFI